MKRLFAAFGIVAACLMLMRLSSTFAAENPAVVVQGRTIVAFFPPVTKADLEKDPDTNEALADFQVYAARLREPLKKSGIEFHQLYTHSFQIRVGKTIIIFRPTKEEIGYYFVVPGKKPRVEYGVMTDVDVLDIAKEYFSTSAQ